MSKPLIKDIIIEIIRTKKRFLSLFFIILIGVGIFGGIKVTSQDMKLTADKYADEYNLFDLQVISTMGLTKGDADSISKIKGIKSINPLYTIDAVVDKNNKGFVVKVISIDPSKVKNDKNYINKPKLIEGRYPETNSECVVEKKFLKDLGLSMNDTVAINLDSQNQNNIKIKKFKIVGVVETPYYISSERGPSNVGNGQVQAFMMVPQSNFSMDTYTEIDVLVNRAKNFFSYSNEYYDYIKPVKDDLVKLSETRNKIRYDEIKNKAQKEINDAKIELEYKKNKYNKELADFKEKLDETSAVLHNSELQLNKKQEILKQQVILSPEVINAQKQLNIKREQLNNALKDLNDNVKKYQDQKAQFDKQINNANEKIALSVEKLNNLKKPIWYVLDRKSNIGFMQFGDEADRIKALGNVFPTIFFLVAALVSLTSMTRMVEEQRTQMGIMKALGYSNFSIMLKFIMYSSIATILGSFTGIILGFNILPRIIFGEYSLMYTLPPVITEFNVNYAILGVVAALMSTTAVTIFVCLSDLKETPASLMRLKSPIAGKRVLLEKINFIWSKLNFMQKVTARNIFRYKKRFFMTVIGIGGCTALLLTGFGIRDSINIIVEKQFNEIFKYQMITTFKNNTSSREIKALATSINNNKNVKESIIINQSSIDVRKGNNIKNAFIVTTSDKGKFNDFIDLRNRITGAKIPLKDDGVVVTEKLANMLGVRTGDYVYLNNSDGMKVKAKVTGITENYLHHYVYITSTLYERLFGKKIASNEILSKIYDSSNSAEDSISQKFLKSPAITSINFISSVKKTLQNVVSNMLSVVLVLIFSAGTLAFVVLYNLTNINITERMRELATMKVLGFYDNEISMYVMRENFILTVIGILFGFAFGVVLHRYLMTTVEVDILMFGRDIEPLSFLYSALITIGFSLLVSIVVHFQLKKVDMVQSLKSPEID